MTRRRYVWDNEAQQLVEVSPDFVPTPRIELMPEESFVYGGQRATDGTPIDTRKRHRDYMKARGLAMASDFTETWAKARAERDAHYSGAKSSERREAVERSIHHLQQRSRR